MTETVKNVIGKLVGLNVFSGKLPYSSSMVWLVSSSCEDMGFKDLTLWMEPGTG